MQLDGQQQMWVSDYYTHIDSAIPMTLELAKDGLEIANVAVSEVFGELLGDDDLDDEFRDMFTSLSHELDTAFYDNQGNIRIDSDNFGESGWFGDTWESEFEQQLESLITQSMGKILISVGTQMLCEGGDMTAFEERMERMAHKLNLNRTQVKSVIRNLVEVPELFGRVQQLAGEMNSDIQDQTAYIENRVTRKLAK